jgi:hypothetical protein
MRQSILRRARSGFRSTITSSTSARNGTVRISRGARPVRDKARRSSISAAMRSEEAAMVRR